ncbi:unnamed protein product [Cylicostephanus goldi]|uniref:Transthyretin/hydroxyisourate hydrolase domain-containing protein n=1 Tax=Cylicostephanus goldi TaxID=71465 RepID=A0A3P7NE29_CYLGO|nr:unnamed protein product [Cylicostephanus goldi]
MLKLLVLATFVCVVSSLGIGRTQSSGVSGKLICDGKPAAGVTVKLYDDDRGMYFAEYCSINVTLWPKNS